MTLLNPRFEPSATRGLLEEHAGEQFARGSFSKMRVIAALSLVASAGAVCIVGTSSSCQVGLTWTVNQAAGTIVFNGTCASVKGPITWCGFGMSPSGLMYPAESWAVIPDGSAVHLEDRHNTAWASPPCFATQSSTLLASSSSGSSLSLSWTRPLNVSAALLAEGYLNVPQGPSHAIGAILYGIAPRSYSSCALLTKHTTPGTAPVTFY